MIKKKKIRDDVAHVFSPTRPFDVFFSSKLFLFIISVERRELWVHAIVVILDLR